MKRFLPALLLFGCSTYSTGLDNGEIRIETKARRTVVYAKREGSWRVLAEVRGEHPQSIGALGDRFTLEISGAIQVEAMGRKSMALFPGLEFLEGDEFSSSDRDAHGPLADRRRPDLWKITVPLMAYEVDGVLIAILWKGPRKAFFEAREKNLMGLEDAGTAVVHIEAGATIYDAVPSWIAAFGLPAPEPWPRTLEEELALCKAGFASVSAGRGKHRHCAGKEWPAEWAPGFGVLLHLLGEKIDWDDYPDLLSTANCHVLRWEAPFQAGQPEAVLKVLPRIRLLVESNEDGEWGFHPMDPKQRTLGKAGDKVLGTSADKIYSIAKAARMTGDDELRKFALESLGKLRRYRVPRGGQAWECPLYEPDLLAAAFAVAAFVEGHKLSGDASLLAEAVRWAKAGLPFLYLWSLPARKGMLYASIPVFGTTHFTHPWFGVPVQWNGLVYAYFLRKLAPLDKSLDWKQIADGITASGTHQQYTDGPSKGCYADGYYDQCTRKAPPDLNPEDLLINILASIGKDPDPDLKLK